MFLNGLGLFFVHFWYFSNEQFTFYNKLMCKMSIKYPVLGFELTTLWYESPPLTTRPGLRQVYAGPSLPPCRSTPDAPSRVQFQMRARHQKTDTSFKTLTGFDRLFKKLTNTYTKFSKWENGGNATHKKCVVNLSQFRSNFIYWYQLL